MELQEIIGKLAGNSVWAALAAAFAWKLYGDLRVAIPAWGERIISLWIDYRNEVRAEKGTLVAVNENQRREFLATIKELNVQYAQMTKDQRDEDTARIDNLMKQIYGGKGGQG